MTIAELQDYVHTTHVSHGFTQPTDPAHLSLRLLLSVGELSEAQNELRSGHDPREIYFSESPETPGVLKPEGFPVEVADSILRNLNILSDIGVDAAYVLALKADYNMRRPSMHGGKKF